MVEIYHIGAMASHDACALQMLGHSAQGVAYHTLLGDIAIEVVDADVVVGRLDEYQVLATNRESHLALLVKNLYVGLLQYRLVTIYLLAKATQFTTILLPHEVDVAHSIRDEKYERGLDKERVEELWYRFFGICKEGHQSVYRRHNADFAEYPHDVTEIGQGATIGVGSQN